MLTQHRDDLLLRAPLALHRPFPFVGPDSNSAWGKTQWQAARFRGVVAVAFLLQDDAEQSLAADLGTLIETPSAILNYIEEPIAARSSELKSAFQIGGRENVRDKSAVLSQNVLMLKLAKLFVHWTMGSRNRTMGSRNRMTREYVEEVTQWRCGHIRSQKRGTTRCVNNAQDCLGSPEQGGAFDKFKQSLS